MVMAYDGKDIFGARASIKKSGGLLPRIGKKYNILLVKIHTFYGYKVIRVRGKM